MGLEKGKHIVKEIAGIRCTVVETGCDQGRVDFLRNLLEFNGYTVHSELEVKKEKEGEPKPPESYIIGVTDIVFNPVIAVYQRMLKTPDGHKVTPDYWNQLTDKTEPNYWDLSKKDFSK